MRPDRSTLPATSVEPRAGTARAALALGIVAFLAAGLTLDDPGITWDEPEYLASAELQITWLAELPGRALDGSLSAWTSADTLARYWHSRPYHNPHPPFYKTLSGSTWAGFHGWLGDYPAFRLSSAVLFGLLVGVLCLWGARAGGAIAGIGAALSFALMPRVFADAHFAATDMPLTAFWCLGAFFFWRASRRGRTADVLLFGVVWGMALATKFTGLFLVLPLVVWGALHAPRALPRLLLVGGIVAAAVMVLLNPYLWVDPVAKYLAFVRDSTSRQEWVPISTFYLGRSYPFELPWHHAGVLTLVTVPLPLLLLAGLGASRLREAVRRPLVSLCCLQLLFYQLLMALPSSPGHDGVRLFLPQFPFLALLAGLGLALLWSRIAERAAAWGAPATRLLRAGLAAVLFLPPAFAIAHAHPLELAYYNEVVGGARGAYARGFESTYWFDAATSEFLERAQRELPRGARVWTSPAPWHFETLQHAGRLRDDLVFTDSLPSPFLLLMTRQGMFTPFHWRLHRFVRPIVEEEYEGVRLMALYRWN
jgi:hypothetical protein